MRAIVGFFAIAFVAAFGAITEAEDSRTSRASFSGLWRYAGDAQEDQLRRRAIAAATKDMPSYIRKRARRHLEKQTVPPRELKLAVTDLRFEATGRGDKVSLQFDAAAVAVEKNWGRGKVSVRFDGDQILFLAEGETGTRLTTYQLSPDQKRLTVSVRITGRRLSDPLVFQSTYERGRSSRR